MTAVFLKLVNMSIAACWLILAVMLIRRLFSGMPKWVLCILWAVVAVRLVCPLSFESRLSLIPSTQTISDNVLDGSGFKVETGFKAVDNQINRYADYQRSETADIEEKSRVDVIKVLSLIWISGMSALVIYFIAAWIYTAYRVRESVWIKDNVRICDNVKSPFVFGLIRPGIYLPSGINEKYMSYVTAHEAAHLKRKDNWWKPIGFLLLCIYWFNPLMWIAFILFCRDIEAACDEKVIKDFDLNSRKEYSKALLSCSAQRKMVMVYSPAFGEVNVKERVKNIMNYKKPTVWIGAAAAVVCIAVMVCFLTNPANGVQGNNSDGVTGGPAANETSGEDEQVFRYKVRPGDELYCTPSVWLNYKDNTFSFGYDSLSSYLSYGTFSEENGKITAVTDDGLYTYIFEVKDEDTIAFVEDGSSAIIMTKGDSVVKDGSEFIRQK